jgi:hypothetical protein
MRVLECDLKRWIFLEISCIGNSAHPSLRGFGLSRLGANAMISMLA